MEGEWFLPHRELLREIEEQKWINRKNGFVYPNPDYDLGDWSLTSSKWDEVECEDWFTKETNYQNQTRVN